MDKTYQGFIVSKKPFIYFCLQKYYWTMLKYTIITLALLLVLLDFLAYRKLADYKLKKSIKRAFAATVIIADIIPLILLLSMLIFSNENYMTSIMKISMVFITIFLVLTICRLILYIFWLPFKSKKWLYFGGVVSFISLLLFTYGIFVTRTDYKVSEISLSYSNMPAVFNGYRIAFISDIHTGSMYDAERELEDIADIISETDADIVLFGGDIINMHHSELTPYILEKLSLIKGKHETLAVLGNHDTGAYLNDSVITPRCLNKKLLKEKLEGIGWVLLQDSTIYLNRNNDSIAITGIDYTDELLKFKHEFDNIEDYDVSPIYSGVDDDVFNITISHLPQLWYELCDNGYSDLTLSGHIHAMQFKYDIFGFILSPAAFVCNEWSGLYEREKGKLYINDGVGTVGFFARLGARPEITVITLNNGL